MISLYWSKDVGCVIKYLIGEDGKLSVEYKEEGVFSKPQKNQIQEDRIYFRSGISEKVNRGYTIFEFDFKKDIIKLLTLPENSPRILKIEILDKNEILLTIREGVNFEFKTGYAKIQNDSLFFDENKFQKVYVKNGFKLEGKSFFVTSRGIGVMTENKKIGNLIKLNSFKINTSTVDKEGNIWLGTKDNGLLFIPSLYCVLYNNTNSDIYSNSSYCIFPYQKDQLIIGQDEGTISIINGEEIFFKKNSPTGQIRAIDKDTENRIWMGGDDIDLSILTKDLTISKKISFVGIKVISCAQRDNIWMSTSGEVFSFPNSIFFKNKNSKK